MPERLIVAYLLIIVLIACAGAAIWWAIQNSPRQRMKRYYRNKHNRSRH